MTNLTQENLKPLFLSPQVFEDVKDAEAAYNDLVEQINQVLMKSLDSNTQRVGIWANSLNRTTHNFLMMGG